MAKSWQKNLFNHFDKTSPPLKGKNKGNHVEIDIFDRNIYQSVS